MTLPPDPSFLVFGAAGHIGRPCAQWLAERHPTAHIRIVSSRPEMAADLAEMHPGGEVMIADYLNADDMVAAFDGIHAAFVLTPDFIDEKVAMANVASAVKASGMLVRLIRLIGDPPGIRDESEVLALRGSDYQNETALHHLRARKVLTAAGLPVVYMNIPGWFFEDFSEFLLDPIRDKRTFVMAADRPMNFIATRDIGRCAAELLLDPSLTEAGETLHLENGIDTMIKFSKIADIMSAAWGVPIAYAGTDEEFLRDLGPALRRYYKHDDAAEHILAECHHEVPFINELLRHGNDLRGGERHLTPEMLGFEALSLTSWLQDKRDVFIPEVS
ncbi:SDR family oxidoreductase [Mycolicibacterium alvei]|uniref:SDR family oxidoreductase n=1 Tax=Mycolicibacterium alvei TaxID=67081 RepID=UPI0013D64C66|nr:NmrA family NAD(P)-binding protein [Mycolicibacterium alvei]MCV7003919.1 NmrA family NAD(P)-binding protein [Mycolicibacterium alvei]